MTYIRRIVIAMLLGICLPASALVDPIAADIEEQGWMANVLIKGSRDQFYTLFCKGSLIDRYWVMTSVSCLDDPYKILKKSRCGQAGICVGTGQPRGTLQSRRTHNFTRQ